MRLIELRKALNLTQEDFAKKINLSRSGIANIEQGTRALTDRSIIDICREFDVNEEWLRNGTGSMFRDLTTNEIITDFYKETIYAASSDIKKKFAKAVASMDQSQWDALEKFLDDLADDKI